MKFQERPRGEAGAVKFCRLESCSKLDQVRSESPDASVEDWPVRLPAGLADAFVPGFATLGANIAAPSDGLAHRKRQYQSVKTVVALDRSRLPNAAPTARSAADGDRSIA